MPSRLWRAAAAGMVAIVACNEGLAPTPAPTTCPAGFVGICGTVTFRGAVPDSTQAVFLVAFDTFPRDTSDVFKFLPKPPVVLPLGGPPYFYTARLPNGRYEWVVAVWEKVGPLTTQTAGTLLEEAGFYRKPSDPALPGVVVVNGTGTDSIDFVIDFGNMHRICTYIPPPCP